MILAILFGAIVGVALGLTGGGGSIFAVPLLVFGLGFDLRRAVAMSLAVVGLTALYGAILQIRRGRVLWRAGGILGLGGIIAAPFGAKAGAWLPEEVLLHLFAALMVLVGFLMLRKPSAAADVPLDWIACGSDPEGPVFTWRCAAKLLIAGAGTGILAGTFGVGGGFLVVPALLVVLRVDVATALATSLVAIFLIAASGLAANIGHLEATDAALGGGFLLGAVAGMSGGVLLKGYLSGVTLKKVFGWAVIATAGYIVVRIWFSS